MDHAARTVKQTLTQGQESMSDLIMPGNRSIRIPKSIEQSNQTGEIVATLTATVTAGSNPDYCRKQIHAL